MRIMDNELQTETGYTFERPMLILSRTKNTKDGTPLFNIYHSRRVAQRFITKTAKCFRTMNLPFLFSMNVATLLFYSEFFRRRVLSDFVLS